MQRRSLISTVERAPKDPILGLTETFNADTRDGKVNLGVGVYLDESGRVPLLECVRAAAERLTADPTPFGYLPIDGSAAYDNAVADLVLSGVMPRDRLAVVQTLGGTGALKVAADFLHTLSPDTTVLLSDPSWENHRALFTRAGFQVDSYPYFDTTTRAVDADGMLDALGRAEAGTIVVLHACCHNPTGVDLTLAQWERVRTVVVERGLVPLLDMAYQGFASGLDADAAAVRAFVTSDIAVFITSSFSKNFSLYGERVGALTVVGADADEAARVLSQLKIAVRTNYSNPPTNGARLATAVLTDPDLRAQWEAELATMRDRIKELRRQLRARLEAARPDVVAAHITDQNGMFSYSGLSAEQMGRLRDEFGVYGLDSGRICVAALNAHNLDTVVAALAQVW